MSFWKNIFKKAEPPAQATSPLIEDLNKAAQWAAENLIASGYPADFSLESLRHLDRFFDTERTGLLAEHEDRGVVLFTLGAYLGQVALRVHGGTWQVDEQDPKAELHVKVLLKTGQAFQPVQACISRYQHSNSQSLYSFVSGMGHESRHQEQVMDEEETEQ